MAERINDQGWHLVDISKSFHFNAETTFAGGRALFGEGTSPAEMFASIFPLVSLKTYWQPFSKQIQMHSFRIWQATGQEIPRSIVQMCTRPSRVGVGFRAEDDPERAYFPSRQFERAA